MKIKTVPSGNGNNGAAIVAESPEPDIITAEMEVPSPDGTGAHASRMASVQSVTLESRHEPELLSAQVFGRDTEQADRYRKKSRVLTLVKGEDEDYEAESEATERDELIDGDLELEDDAQENGDVLDFSDCDDGKDEESHLPSPSGPRDNLRVYLQEVSRFPLLDPEEEHELATRLRDSNDPDAAFRLVSSHLRLVVRIAMDFQRRWMQNVLDLVQEGNVGLLRAVNKFDPDKGIKFSYYASFWIKAYILKFIMDNWRMVKIGTTQAQRKLFYNLNRERQKLVAQGFDPDAAMLAERLGVSEEQITEMDLRLTSTDMSLNAQVCDENGSSSRMDFLPALAPGVEDSIASLEIAKLIRSKIKGILPQLNEKEKYILHHRLLSDEPATLREIGERYNVTRERVRQLEARLLEKIRTHLTLDVKDFSQEWIES